MKKGLYLTLLILIFAFACQKAVQKAIIGEWEITETKVVNTDNYLKQFKKKFNATKDQLDLEKARINSLPSSYYPTGIVMKFADSSNFYFGGVKGKWHYFDNNKLIEIHLSMIDTARFEIKKLTNKSLIMWYETKFSGIPLQIELKLKRVQ